MRILGSILGSFLFFSPLVQAGYNSKVGKIDSLWGWEDDTILMVSIDEHFRCALPIKKDGKPINQVSEKLIELAFSLGKEVKLFCNEDEHHTKEGTKYWNFHSIIVRK